MNERVRDQSISESNADGGASPRHEDAPSGAPGFAPQRWSNLVHPAPDDPDADAGFAFNNGTARPENTDPLIEPYPDDDDAPLPPLPDGGLAQSMPSWLQSGPIADSGETTAGEPGGVGDSWARTVGTPAAAGIETGSRTTGDRSGTASQDRSETARPSVEDPVRNADEPVVLLEASDLPAWLRALDAPLNAPAPVAAVAVDSGPRVILEIFSPSIPVSRTMAPVPAAPIELPWASAAASPNPLEPVMDSGEMGQPHRDAHPPTAMEAPVAPPDPEPSSASASRETGSPGPASGFVVAVGEPSGLATAANSEHVAAHSAPPARAVPFAGIDQLRPDNGREEPSGRETIGREAPVSDAQPVVEAEPAMNRNDGERMVFGPLPDQAANEWVFGREVGGAADEREIWHVSEAADRQRSRILPALGAVVLLFLIMMLIAYAGFTFR